MCLILPTVRPIKISYLIHIHKVNHKCVTPRFKLSPTEGLFSYRDFFPGMPFWVWPFKLGRMKLVRP